MMWRRHFRACLLTLRGQHPRALGIYREILQSEPDDPAALSVVLQDARIRSAVDETALYAQAALSRMPANFLALDALAWVHISRGEHHQAKVFVERAMQSGQELKLGAPPSLGMKISITIARVIVAIIRRRRLRAVAPVSAAVGSGSRWYAEWKQWALNYLSWYAQTYGSGPNPAESSAAVQQ